MNEDAKIIPPYWQRTRRMEITETTKSKMRKLAYLNERVNYTDIGAGVKHFVEVGLSVYKL